MNAGRGALLAYVFWHWRRADVSAEEYVRKLLAFHAALNRRRHHGYVGSMTFRAGPAPWVPGSESYEDWYLTEGSHVLDRLNEAAVTGDTAPPHDAVARAAENGIAGLYRVRVGVGDVTRARWSAWLSKPSGLAYAEFLEGMERVRRRAHDAGQVFDLWQRQMTLGPTPEFCVMSDRPLVLEGFEILERALHPLWRDEVLAG